MSKRLIVITVALLVALTGVAIAQETEKAAAAPRLTVAEPVKDFGTVAKGEKLTWSFVVKNTGTSNLEITAARPACGCTVADFDKVIKPGESGKVTAIVDTATFVGPIAKPVTIETNDTNTPTAQLTIHAIVKPYVEAHPAGLVRVNLLQGEAEKQSLVIFSEEVEPFEITKIEVPQEWIRTDFVKLEGDQIVPGVGRAGQAQYRVNVTVGGPDARIGPIAEKIQVVTNSSHQPVYPITISGVIRPSIRVEPTGVNFGEVSPSDSAATRSILLRSNNLKAPESFVVTKAESLAKGIKANFKPTTNKGEYEVILEVAKDAKVGDIDGSVKIYTSDLIHPIVTVPVKGTIKKNSPQAAK